jgi:hypothetical protein
MSQLQRTVGDSLFRGMRPAALIRLTAGRVSPALDQVKDSDGGFSRAYGQMGPFLGARTNSLGLGQREGETKGLE